MGAPLARERLAISLVIRGGADGWVLVRVDQDGESPGEITHAASQVGERI